MAICIYSFPFMRIKKAHLRRDGLINGMLRARPRDSSGKLPYTQLSDARELTPGQLHACGRILQGLDVQL